jgi:hypothetical protein
MLAFPPHAIGNPNDGGENQGGKRKMSGEAVLADINTVNEAGGNHVPAQRSLGAAENENCKQLRPQGPFNPAGEREIKQRQGKGHADEAAQETMGPFPPVDEFEFRQRHAPVLDLVLRNEFVFFKGDQPIRFIQWWNCTQQGPPFGDRQAAISQTGGAADDDHAEHEKGHGIKPEAHLWRRGLSWGSSSLHDRPLRGPKLKFKGTGVASSSFDDVMQRIELCAELGDFGSEAGRIVGAQGLGNKSCELGRILFINAPSYDLRCSKPNAI